MLNGHRDEYVSICWEDRLNYRLRTRAHASIVVCALRRRMCNENAFRLMHWRWMQLVCVDAKYNSSPSTQHSASKKIWGFFRAASPLFSSLISCSAVDVRYYLLILIIVENEIGSRFHLPSIRYWSCSTALFSHRTWIRINAIHDSAIVRNKDSVNCLDIHFAVIN